MKNIFINAVKYLKNTDVDIRTRLLFLVEYAALVACIVGTITMLLFTTTIYMLIPNFILLVLCISGLFISHYHKNYGLAANLFTIGCAYISLPVMFFTAGGNNSGMIMWFLFATVFCCVISRGKSRIIMPTIMIIIAGICMLVGYYYPNLVTRLENRSAEFFDTFQSFLIVSVMIFVTLCAYLSTYDRQSRILEEQSEELKKLVYTDSLTGIANRHAYYEKIGEYKDGDAAKDLVVVAMDVNGLKRVNDTEGHAAGDSLIKCAADIMAAAFDGLGNVYRTGGDEFIAILFCADSELGGLRGRLDDAVRRSEDENSNNMTIAMGIAAWNLEKDATFFELEKLADGRMYQDKSEYYKQACIDRRS